MTGILTNLDKFITIQTLTTFDKIGPILTNFELIMTSLSLFWQVWSKFDKIKPILTNMTRFWQIWNNLTNFDKFEPILTVLNQFWQVWTNFDKFDQNLTWLTKLGFTPIWHDMTISWLERHDLWLFDLDFW